MVGYLVGGEVRGSRFGGAFAGFGRWQEPARKP